MTRARQIRIGAVCVLAGAWIGYYGGRYVTWREMVGPVHDMETIMADQMESDAKQRLFVIGLLQRGETDTVLRMNCLFLRSRIRHLDPADYPDRIADVQQLVDKATTKVAELEKSDHCAPRSKTP